MENIAKKIILFFVSILFCLLLSCSEDFSTNDYYFNHPPGNYWEEPVYPNIDGYPVSSPDGRQMMYYHAGIITISKDGLVETDAGSAGLWMINADGSWIVFEDGGQIYKVPIIGDSGDSIVVSRIQQLTFGGSNFFPAWSPDGEWIAYDSNSESSNGMNFIWIMKSDGTQKKRISYEPLSGEIRMPDWSSSGNQIVHQRYIGIGASEIFTMDISGSNPPSIRRHFGRKMADR